MRILRVFPRRTNATPGDDMAFIGEPGLFRPPADEVHVSVAFTWDLEEGRRLVNAWSHFYPVVRLGGPAMGPPPGEFVPGRYLKEGHIITHRGCPNGCRFCFVPEREGKVRTLPIGEGHILHDNNILACPGHHVDAVFDMLARQNNRPVFAGGLEARRVTLPIAHRISALRARAYLAYDRMEDTAAVHAAITTLLFVDPREGHWLSCYVMVGYYGDTITAARDRLEWVKARGVTPLAMYYLPKDAKSRTAPHEWRKFVKAWSRPSIIWAKKKQNPLDPRMSSA